MLIRFTKQQNDFIEAVSNKVNDVEGSDWYYMPFWFKKISEDLYEQYSFENLPTSLKTRLEEDRQYITDYKKTTEK